MLTSLFGDLEGTYHPADLKTRGTPRESESGFAATAISETFATGVNNNGQMVDRHLHDLVVSGPTRTNVNDFRALLIL